MQKKCYRITVTLRSPLHINGGTDADGTRVPVMMGGKPYIPATAMKGMIRDKFSSYLKMLGVDSCTCKEKAEKSCGCPACVLFGKAGFQPSRVFLDHLTAVPDAEPVLSLRTNVAIDRKLLTGKDRMLVGTKVIEPQDRRGRQMCFSGEMTVWYAGDPDDIRKTEFLLLESVKSVIEIGGGKSRGFGLVETEVTAL